MKGGVDGNGRSSRVGGQVPVVFEVVEWADGSTWWTWQKKRFKRSSKKEHVFHAIFSLISSPAPYASLLAGRPAAALLAIPLQHETQPPSTGLFHTARAPARHLCEHRSSHRRSSIIDHLRTHNTTSAVSSTRDATCEAGAVSIRPDV